MKDSTSDDVYRWLLAHAEKCEPCGAAIDAAREGLDDRSVYDRCCRAGQPMVYQFQRKKLKESGR